MVLEPISNFLPPVSFPRLLKQTLPSAAVEQAETGRTRQIQETAKQFEGLLLQQVFKQMKGSDQPRWRFRKKRMERKAVLASRFKVCFGCFWPTMCLSEGGIGLWKQMAEQWSRRESANNAAKSAGLDEQI